MKRVLLIAFHFPPAAGTSGVHRSHSLARGLRRHGWDPIVLTASTRAHPVTSVRSADDIPSDLRVVRAAAWDAARHWSIAGHYPGIFEWPDRWVSWFPAAVVRALRLVREYRPAVIWSTYPIATAHLVGLVTAKLTGLPWIADFRDSMTDDGYPPPGPKRNLIERIESKIVYAASRVVFTAPGTLDMYASRYPEVPEERWQLILNGYDEEKFGRAEQLPFKRESDKLLLLHSGCIYPEERDPSALFEAIASLRKSGQISAESLEVRLRASGHDHIFAPLLEQLQIADIVNLAPSLDYSRALSEMMHADGLLLLQAASCNHQIPAKAFEYLRAGRPILALTDANGDTAGLLRQWQQTHIAPLDSAAEIGSALLTLIQRACEESKTVDAEMILQYSRDAQVRRTAELFDSVLAGQIERIANVTGFTDSGKYRT